MSKLASGEFTHNVWKLARSIPPGRVVTYGSLAVAAGGHPMMARMITTILSKVPDSDAIPFHRIVYANGKVWLGRRSLGEVGLDPKYTKERLKLYKKEGIKLDKNNRIIDFEKLIYLF
jgi:methylated-DNA-protein-cysteine methyltransferase related protein